ncbi:uncharacterized protein (DUF302 family) [Melghirimyces profundicolus]|uniref:Uncharacterized protein (DUF302 family) n=1 Tax=Melghirimyces profundicolus TaxID=1242148 RepID=A0A2T6BUA1_9BACL|nr:DUF302 domain-containing protein [Melghirimyces profundicolus]PTX59665.1 uncharacterized protein (DUF302 family) [Melghirimyces profundicolus]
MFDYTVVTNKTVDEAIRALEQTLSNHKFGVLWKLDIPTKLMEKGIALEQDFRVLEVCNPDVAKKVLTRNQKGGYFLPCKIVVYRSDETLKTHIGLLRPTTLMAMTEDERLQALAEDVERTMVQAIDEAK